MDPTTSLGLTGQAIIVTGAAGGIGGATVRMPVEHGLEVLAVDHASQRLQEVVATLDRADQVAVHFAYPRCTASHPAHLPTAVA